MSAVPAGIPSVAGRRFRVPPNASSIAFGLSGFADMWRAAGPVLGIPTAVPDALFIATATVWFVLVAAYALQRPSQLRADLRDPVLAPFLSIPLIVGLTLGGALASVAFTAGRTVVIVFMLIALAFGGWLTGQCICAGSWCPPRPPRYRRRSNLSHRPAASSASTSG